MPPLPKPYGQRAVKVDDALGGSGGAAAAAAPACPTGSEPAGFETPEPKLKAGKRQRLDACTNGAREL
eukprot:6768238-Prorocentrum_lima.AAC.1